MQLRGALSSSAEAQRMVQWLLYVCVVVVTSWVIARAFDVSAWLAWAMDAPPVPAWVATLRVFFLRVTGLVDVLLFSQICETCLGMRHTNQARAPSVAQDVSASRWTTVAGLVLGNRRSSQQRAPSVTTANPRPTASSSRHPLALKIFATSWNMGGRPAQGLEKVIPHWIPAGYDLYVVAVQECTCLKQVRAAIHEALGELSSTVPI